MAAQCISYQTQEYTGNKRLLRTSMSSLYQGKFVV
jgi:hypothetical protein